MSIYQRKQNAKSSLFPRFQKEWSDKNTADAALSKAKTNLVKKLKADIEVIESLTFDEFAQTHCHQVAGSDKRLYK